MKLQLKKWSLIGLILTGASAVIAAVIPSKDDEPEIINGSLTISTGWYGDPYSCKHSFFITNPCRATDFSNTTAGMLIDSLGPDDEGGQTVDNTTLFENLYW